MKKYLIDVPTLTSVWVTARSAPDAIKALRFATKNLELRIPIGTSENPIELINFTLRGEPEIVEGDEDEDDCNDVIPGVLIYPARKNTLPISLQASPYSRAFRQKDAPMMSLDNVVNDPQIRWHQAEVFRLLREEAAEDLLSEATSALTHPYLPSREIRLQPKAPGRKGWWLKADGFAISTEAYADSLIAFDKVARNSRTPISLAALNVALMDVMEQANKLGFQGWVVNWQQNIQWALRGSRFGLSGYSVIGRYENLADRTTLSERLETIGSLTFYKQSRTSRRLGSVEPMLFSGKTEVAYDSVFLSLTSAGRFYRGDWIDSPRGGSVRLLSD